MFSISEQKRIMWIPLVNYINLGAFVYNCRKLKIGSRAWWLGFAYYFGYCIVGWLLGAGLNIILPDGSLILTVYGWFVFPLFASHGLIRYQEKYLYF